MNAGSPVRGPVAARLLPGRLFYGWYIAIACACLMFVGVGVGYYGLPIFLKPLRDAHGWSDTQVSVAPAIYFTVSGLTSAIVGPYVDRYGPNKFMLIGTVVNGVSAAFIGLVVQFMPREWRGLEWPVFAPLIKCGQHSLEVFCVGVYLSFVAHFILITFSNSVPMQLAVGAGGLAIMVTVAWYRAWSKDVDRPTPRLVPASAKVKAAIPPPPWHPISERRRRRHESAERIKAERAGIRSRE